MNVFENRELRNRLCSSFPKCFLNGNFEFIAHPSRNSYFILDGIETELELKAKIIEWLSREAIKGGSRMSQKYHLDGINLYLGTHFAREDMEKIYTHLGNAVNHNKTILFIESGYDMTVLGLEVVA